MNTQKTVLLVDDDKELNEILGDQLEEAGFKVIRAYDGEEGLQAALTHKPDLILLDILMPKKDGIAALEKLRKDEWGKTAQVLFLTVVDQPEILSRAVELGGYDYLVKTEWKVGEIVDRVKKKLNI